VLCCGFGHLPGLVQIQRQRFFAQHMFACTGGRDGPRRMQAVGQGQVDGIDVGVGQQGLVAAERPLDLILACKGLGVVGLAAGHGRHHQARAAAHIANELAGDIGAAEHAHTQGLAAEGKRRRHEGS